MRLIALAIVAFVPGVASAQPSPPAAPATPAPVTRSVSPDRDPAMHWLLLKRAYLQLRDHEEDLTDGEEQVSQRRTDALQRGLERARLEYGAMLASLLPVVPRLVVVSAVKRQQSGQNPTVQIGLRSLPVEWPDALRQASLPALEADLNSLGTIRNALVMVKNSMGTVIGLPLQVTIESVKPREYAMAEFRLQEAVSSIIVALSYAGRVEEYSLRLAAVGPPLRVDSAQVSQNADFGETAVYDLRIERTTPRIRVLRLQAVGLPPQFRHEFVIDPAPGAIRLSQYRFHDEELVRPMLLRVQLPEVLGDREDVVPDSPLRFRARAVDASNQDAGEKEGPSADVELELIPRGVGRLTLQSPNFLVEGGEGSTIRARIELKNVGSREVQDIKPTLEMPAGWTATVSPAEVPLLRANEARSLELLFQPGSAGAGDYTVKIRAAGGKSSRDTAVTADLRVRVAGRTSYGGMLGFFGGLVGLVAAVTYFGSRLARW